MLKKLCFFFMLLTLVSYAKDKRTIVFSPLPTKSSFQVLKDFLPFTSYLENKLNIKIKYEYKSNYKDILDGIKNGSIDMAYLGPLPFVSLKQEYSKVRPIVTFVEKNGKHNYRCVLAKFKADKVDLSKKIKVALTQPLSTCGYFMSSILLNEKYKLDISKLSYDYKMSHDNALLSVLSGDFLLAGAKDSIAKKHSSLGIEILASSQLLPGFTLVTNNKTLEDTFINKLQNTILEIPKTVYKNWKGKGSYGFVKASHEDYGDLSVNMNEIPKVGNINE